LAPIALDQVRRHLTRYRWLSQPKLRGTAPGCVAPPVRTQKNMQRRLLLATLLVLSTPALAEDPAIALGRDIVTRDCSGCHATGPTGDSPLAIAPHFRELGRRYDLDFLAEALVEGIVTAHAEMPQFTFEPGEAEAIILYLKSIQTE
jgi:cytochrome c